jgi:FkbM family methyltransferase
VYDLGANTGLHCLLASRLVGPEGRVVGFEPLPENLHAAADLISLNELSNVELVSKAVGKTVGVAEFLVGMHGKQGSLVGIGRESGERLAVAVTTLDAECDAGRPSPDFVKIDVEGAEGDVLLGFSRRLKECKPVFIIDLHSPQQDLKVGRTLHEAGYELFRVGDAVAKRVTGQSSLIERIPDPSRCWPDPRGVWGSLLAVHRASELCARAISMAGGSTPTNDSRAK